MAAATVAEIRDNAYIEEMLCELLLSAHSS
jgi:hypothetical protein